QGRRCGYDQRIRLHLGRPGGSRQGCAKIYRSRLRLSVLSLRRAGPTRVYRKLRAGGIAPAAAKCRSEIETSGIEASARAAEELDAGARPAAWKISRFSSESVVSGEKMSMHLGNTMRVVLC